MFDLKKIRQIENRNLITVAVSTTLALVLAGIGVSACNKKGDTASAPANTTTTTSVDASVEPTETADVTVSTGDYVLETLNPDYVSETRETTGADEANTIGSSNTINGTVQSIKDTTPNGQVTVIENPTIQTQEPVSNETTEVTKPTDINGTVAETTAYTEPKGTDELPIEPTKITVNVTDPTVAPTTTNPTSSTSTTEYTVPTETVETIIISVPIETVDPNDPNNVIEKDIKGKVLVLNLR